MKVTCLEDLARHLGIAPSADAIQTYWHINIEVGRRSGGQADLAGPLPLVRQPAPSRDEGIGLVAFWGDPDIGATCNVKHSEERWTYPFDSKRFDQFLAMASQIELCPEHLRPSRDPDVLIKRLASAKAEAQQLRATQAELVAALSAALEDLEALRAGAAFDEVCGIIPHVRKALRSFMKRGRQQELLL